MEQEIYVKNSTIGTETESVLGQLKIEVDRSERQYDRLRNILLKFTPLDIDDLDGAKAEEPINHLQFMGDLLRKSREQNDRMDNLINQLEKIF